MSESKTKVDKTVTIVGYITLDGDERDVANQMDSERDYKETKTRETVNRFVNGPGGVRHKVTNDDKWEELRNSNLGDFELEEDIITDEVFHHRTNKVARVYFDELVKPKILDSVPERLEYNRIFDRLDSGDDTVVNFYRFMDTMPMLKHQSEMTEEDMYVDEDEEFVVLKYRVKFNGLTEDEVDSISEVIVNAFVDTFRKDDRIGKVRFVDCEEKRKGACYNV